MILSLGTPAFTSSAIKLFTLKTKSFKSFFTIRAEKHNLLLLFSSCIFKTKISPERKLTWCRPRPRVQWRPKSSSQTKRAFQNLHDFVVVSHIYIYILQPRIAFQGALYVSHASPMVIHHRPPITMTITTTMQSAPIFFNFSLSPMHLLLKKLLWHNQCNSIELKKMQHNNHQWFIILQSILVCIERVYFKAEGQYYMLCPSIEQ